MIDLDRPATERDVRVFGRLLPPFLALFGLLLWTKGRAVGAGTLWVAAGLLAAAFCAAPSLRRPVYAAWMFFVRPVGWLVSHLAVALVYYGLFTPVGWLLRTIGGDPMQRRFERGRASYWLPREGAPEAERYFRQY